MTDDIAEQGRRLHAAHQRRDAVLAAVEARVEALAVDMAPPPLPVVLSELAEILGLDLAALLDAVDAEGVQP